MGIWPTLYTAYNIMQHLIFFHYSRLSSKTFNFQHFWQHWEWFCSSTAVHRNGTAYVGSKYQVWILFVLRYLPRKAFQAQANPLHLTLLFERTDGNTAPSITEFVYKSLILEGLTLPPRFWPQKEMLCIYLFKANNKNLRNQTKKAGKRWCEENQ